MTLATGSLLAGRYEITGPIATGGMGEVWKARDRVLDRIVAAKVLKTEYTNDPSFLARFRNEARHTAALTHPNIASVYDYGETSDDLGTALAFLVMEYVEGPPLVTILHDEGALPVDWTLHVLEQAADGLSAAHRAGVVHRDIKPGNLIVRPDGVVKLTDFGIAQARDATPLTRTGMVVGTAQYLSPEQAQGMEVTAASDVYSLGVVGYECLTGARPFDGASQVAIALAHINRPPPPLPASVPPAVRILIERSLAKDPADRFPDGGAFAEAVRRVATGGSLAAAPASPPTAPTRVVDPSADGRTTVLPAVGPPTTGGRHAVRTGPVGPMPPLHAADDEDDWPAEDDGAPPQRRSRRRLWLLAALLLLLLLGGAGYLLATSGDGDGGRTAEPTPSSASPTTPAATVPIGAPSEYIGRPADDVRTELKGLGLVDVRLEPATEEQLTELGQELDAGDVAGVAPAGQAVDPATAVTVYLAEDGWTVAEEEEEEEEEQPEEEQPTPTAAPSPTGRPTTSPTGSPTNTATGSASGSGTSSPTPTAPGTTPVEPPPDEPPPGDEEAVGQGVTE
ncbi:serine/threonine-protein kinase [Blastococcus sp. TF02A-30]|uniref:serine/threonine-protein kinase n=1 Tax=Blastococcus sp. TF02A-30 TaxID=2250580 RepID=UPI000DEB62AB|nr:serine/threonine-protein kinase [Blastococcus sp. TF02A-30]RBY92625.1 serine/threonine protein kinase [Blastococcus sp. TF02A-30]